MALTKDSVSGNEGVPARADAPDQPAPGAEPTFNASPNHPDEVVQPVREVASPLIAEAKLRHELAKGDTATFQEKKQAAVEQAHALSTRPDGSYAQLHETASPSLAVADEGVLSDLREQNEQAQQALQGSAPAGSPAGLRADEEAARQRSEASQASAPQGQQQSAAQPQSQQAAKGDAPKGQSSK